MSNTLHTLADLSPEEEHVWPTVTSVKEGYCNYMPPEVVQAQLGLPIEDIKAEMAILAKEDLAQFAKDATFLHL